MELNLSIKFHFTEVWHDHTSHTTVPGTRAHGHVSGLRPAVTYQFRMYADNELGRSQASDVGIGRARTIYKSNPALVNTRFVADDAPNPHGTSALSLLVFTSRN